MSVAMKQDGKITELPQRNYLVRLFYTMTENI